MLVIKFGYGDIGFKMKGSIEEGWRGLTFVRLSERLEIGGNKDIKDYMREELYTVTFSSVEEVLELKAGVGVSNTIKIDFEGIVECELDFNECQESVDVVYRALDAIIKSFEEVR